MRYWRNSTWRHKNHVNQKKNGKLILFATKVWLESHNTSHQLLWNVFKWTRKLTMKRWKFAVRSDLAKLQHVRWNLMASNASGGNDCRWWSKQQSFPDSNLKKNVWTWQQPRLSSHFELIASFAAISEMLDVPIRWPSVHSPSEQMQDEICQEKMFSNGQYSDWSGLKVCFFIKLREIPTFWSFKKLFSTVHA